MPLVLRGFLIASGIVVISRTASPHFQAILPERLYRGTGVVAIAPPSHIADGELQNSQMRAVGWYGTLMKRYK